MHHDELTHVRWKSRRFYAAFSLSFGIAETNCSQDTSASAILAFSKIHKCKINFKLNDKNCMITYQEYRHEKFAWRKCRKISLKAIVSPSRKLISRFPHKMFVIILRNIIYIGLENFLCSFSQS